MLTKFITNHFPETHLEGNCEQIPKQIEHLKKICDLFVKDDDLIIEIGFNAGHSAEVFLKHTFARVVSFDLGDHVYVNKAKEYIDQNYPERHTLILGDSAKTVPRFLRTLEDKPKLVFIDGNHSYEGALTDLRNDWGKGTIIVMDDIVKEPTWNTDWTEGPGRAWKETVNENRASEICHFDYNWGRGMVLGIKN